jgi:hypothetical protein
MMIAPAVMAAALTIDFQGLSVITPWKSPTDGTARVWVFLPDTSQPGMMAHRARLSLAKGSVLESDWKPDSTGPNDSGVWDLEGFVLSVYREGVKESPDKLLTSAAGKEESPWQNLRWVLNLSRIVPNGRIERNPFGEKHAIAAIKLSDGDLDAAPPRHAHPYEIWIVEPATPQYKQAFTDTVRYRVDLKDTSTELRLDPVPGGNKPAKRIRLVTKGSNPEIGATVTYLPLGKSTMKAGHVSAAALLFADRASRDRVAAASVQHVHEIGGDPLCDSLVVNLKPMPGPCIRCAIDLAPASSVR